MCPYHELGYIQDIHNFSDIEVFIRKHLVLTSYMPSKGKGASGRKNTQESKKENSRSPAKKSPQQREREKSRTRESIRARVHTEAAVEELLKV